MTVRDNPYKQVNIYYKKRGKYCPRSIQPIATISGISTLKATSTGIYVSRRIIFVGR